jgi:hypothetical protein
MSAAKMTVRTPNEVHKVKSSKAFFENFGENFPRKSDSLVIEAIGKTTSFREDEGGKCAKETRRNEQTIKMLKGSTRNDIIVNCNCYLALGGENFTLSITSSFQAHKTQRSKKINLSF